MCSANSKRSGRQQLLATARHQLEIEEERQKWAIEDLDEPDERCIAWLARFVSNWGQPREPQPGDRVMADVERRVHINAIIERMAEAESRLIALEESGRLAAVVESLRKRPGLYPAAPFDVRAELDKRPWMSG